MWYLHLVNSNKYIPADKDEQKDVYYGMTVNEHIHDIWTQEECSADHCVGIKIDNPDFLDYIKGRIPTSPEDEKDRNFYCEYIWYAVPQLLRCVCFSLDEYHVDDLMVNSFGRRRILIPNYILKKTGLYDPHSTVFLLNLDMLEESSVWIFLNRKNLLQQCSTTTKSNNIKKKLEQGADLDDFFKSLIFGDTNEREIGDNFRRSVLESWYHIRKNFEFVSNRNKTMIYCDIYNIVSTERKQTEDLLNSSTSITYDFLCEIQDEYIVKRNRKVEYVNFFCSFEKEKLTIHLEFFRISEKPRVHDNS